MEPAALARFVFGRVAKAAVVVLAIVVYLATRSTGPSRPGDAATTRA